MQLNHNPLSQRVVVAEELVSGAPLANKIAKKIPAIAAERAVRTIT